LSIWEGLAKLFQIKRLFRDVKLFSDNRQENKTYIDKRTQILNINVFKIDSQDEEQLQKVLKKTVQEENQLILEKESDKLFEELLSFDPKNHEELDYFKGRIPYKDLPILRASLFLKSQYEASKSVDKLKTDIMTKYGDRGKNIANLCSAGYFQKIIKPLYQHMSSKPDFTQKEFEARYEIIVMQFPFAVFVSRAMSHNEIKKIIIQKIEINKKYGVKYLRIHGIGGENVKKIKEVIQDKEIESKYTALPEIDSGQEFITVKISF